MVAWLVWPADDSADEPRERRYREVTACLLTDADGVAGEVAAPVWAGMQSASVRTLVRVQYLAVRGEQTPENAAAYMASLAQGGCGLIFAVGEAPVAAALDKAADFPDSRFVVVGGPSTAVSNVSVIPVGADGTLQAAVDDLVVQVLG